MRYALALALAAINGARAQAPAGNAVPVTVDNFTRAESDLYFGGILKDSGAIGKFFHRREPARIDSQTVIRLNRNTLYSSALFDLDAGRSRSHFLTQAVVSCRCRSSTKITMCLKSSTAKAATP
jgi:hypothetical protein